MIPTPDQLDEIARRPEGNLRELPFAALLRALAAAERTVTLEIRRGQLTKDILFEDGVLVDCRSNLVHETLGRFMVAQGRLSQQEHDDCLEESTRRAVPLGEVLRERGLVGSSELFRILQQNLAKKLLDGFTWGDGEYRLRTDAPDVRSPLKVRVPQLIVTGVTRFTPQAEVNAGVWPLVGRKLGLVPAPAFDPGRLKLPTHQRSLAELLRQPRDIKELAEASGVPFEEVTRLIYALGLLGAVVPAEELPETAWGSRVPWLEGPTEEPRQTAAAADSAEPIDPLEAERWRDRVMAAYLAHRRQDPFDLLEIREDAPAADLREAFLTFAHRYAPWRYLRPELASVQEEARDLFLAGARAFGELMDPEQRNTLLYRRRVLAEEQQKATGTSFQIKTDLLDPEKQYAKGQALLEAGKHREALSLLEFAADCDPQNALYRAEAAYCRFSLDPALHAARASEELAEALRIDPRCGLAAFYAGEVFRQQGDLEAAEIQLRRANQLMAPDRRPIEALKALARQQKKR